MSADNNTVYGLARFSWAAFDRLPPPLRQVLNYSVFDMGTDFIVGQLSEGANPFDLAAELELLDANNAARLALSAYGPRYPALRPLPPRGGRAKRTDQLPAGGSASAPAIAIARI
jgi:hypothetical protein